MEQQFTKLTLIPTILCLFILTMWSGAQVQSCDYCNKPPPHPKHETDSKPNVPQFFSPIIPQAKHLPCPPPPESESAGNICPVDTAKLVACVGGLVHIGLEDTIANQCCPIIQGLLEAEAAVCLCTTLKLELVDLNIYVPLALQLLIACGKTPPPYFTCIL